MKANKELPRFAIFAGPDPARRGSMFGASEHESWAYDPMERDGRAWGSVSRRNSISRRESRGAEGLASRVGSFLAPSDHQVPCCLCPMSKLTGQPAVNTNSVTCKLSFSAVACLLAPDEARFLWLLGDNSSLAA